MSYQNVQPTMYQWGQHHYPWHQGGAGWTAAPVPMWGVNPALVGPRQVAVGADPSTVKKVMLGEFLLLSAALVGFVWWLQRGSKSYTSNAYGRRYAGDPYWLTVKYPGSCRRCGKQIRKGERAFRYKDGSLYCDSDACGRAESRSFEAAAFDEDMFNRNASRRHSQYSAEEISALRRYRAAHGRYWKEDLWLDWSEGRDRDPVLRTMRNTRGVGWLKHFRFPK